MKVKVNEIIDLLILGYSQKEIAEKLNICASSLEKKVNALKAKTGAKTYFQLGYKIAKKKGPKNYKV